MTPNVVWWCRPGGAITNGAGFDSTVTGAGTDYSQQDAAQWSATDLAGSTSSTGDLFVTTSTAGSSSPNATTWPGNNLHITAGTGFTAGYYTIVSVSGSGPWTLTLDRAPCSALNATGGTGAVGGAHSEPFQLLNGAAGTGVSPGHIVNIWSRTGIANKLRTSLGAAMTTATTGSVLVGDTTGMPTGGPYYFFIDTEIVLASVVDATHINVTARTQLTSANAAHAIGAAVTYIDYGISRAAATISGSSGNVTVGRVIVRGANGLPTITNCVPGSGSTFITSTAPTYMSFEGISFVAARSTVSSVTRLLMSTGVTYWRCEFYEPDAFAPTGSGAVFANGATWFRECSFETEAATSQPSTNPGNGFVTNAAFVEYCLFKNCSFSGVVATANIMIRGCVFTGIYSSAISTGVNNVTIDGNTFDNCCRGTSTVNEAIRISASAALATVTICNNLFANNTSALNLGTIGVSVNTAALNDKLSMLTRGGIYSNYFYNNTNNYGGITGPHTGDVTSTTTPAAVDPGFTAAKRLTGDWSISTALAAQGYPSASQLPAGLTSRSYIDPGAIQRLEPPVETESYYVG